MYYAAFGIFTSERTMHSLIGDDAVLVGRGIVDGWRFQWRGCADTEQAPGHRLEVVVWEINATHLARLDRVEGYPRHYDRVTVTVEARDSEGGLLAMHDALMYTMATKGRVCPPNDGMLQSVYNAYELHGMNSDKVIEAAVRAEREWEFGDDEAD